MWTETPMDENTNYHLVKDAAVNDPAHKWGISHIECCHWTSLIGIRNYMLADTLIHDDLR